MPIMIFSLFVVYNIITNYLLFWNYYRVLEAMVYLVIYVLNVLHILKNSRSLKANVTEQISHCKNYYKEIKR